MLHINYYTKRSDSKQENHPLNLPKTDAFITYYAHLYLRSTDVNSKETKQGQKLPQV